MLNLSISNSNNFIRSNCQNIIIYYAMFCWKLSVDVKMFMMESSFFFKNYNKQIFDIKSCLCTKNIKLKLKKSSCRGNLH